MARKKQSSRADVIGPELGRWLGRCSNDGQMALIIDEMHSPVWYV